MVERIKHRLRITTTMQYLSVSRRITKFDFSAKSYRERSPYPYLYGIEYERLSFVDEQIRDYDSLLDEHKETWKKLQEQYFNKLDSANVKIRNFFFKWMHGLDRVLADHPYEFFLRKGNDGDLRNIVFMVVDLFDRQEVPERVYAYYLHILEERKTKNGK